MHVSRRSLIPVLAGLASVLPAGPVLAQESLLDLSAEESAETLRAMAPTNAALVYYQHFVVRAGTDLHEIYVHFNADPDDDEIFGHSREDAEALIEKYQEELDTLAWAATLPECDFGVRYQEGWDTLLPHLSKIRSLARLFEADARRHLALGDADKAVERLVTLHNMSLQLRQDRVLISSLVGRALTLLALPLAEEMVESGQLTEEGRDTLIASLERFIKDDDPLGLRACIEMEGLMSVGWIAIRSERDGFFPHLVEQFGEGMMSKATARRLERLSRDELLAEAERMNEFYARVLDAWDDPDVADKIETLGAIVEVGGFGELAQVFAAQFGSVRDRAFKLQDEVSETLDALYAYRPPEAADADDEADDEAEPSEPGATEAPEGR